MIVQDHPAFNSHRTIPLRPGSRQAYILKPLDVRRNYNVYDDDQKWTELIEEMTRKETGVNFENYNLENEHSRKEFIYKVFGLLSCQLSYIMITLLIFFAFGLACIPYFLLVCFEKLRKIHLINFILVTFLVIFLAKGISAVACIYRMYTFIFAFAIQMSVAMFITIMAKFAPCDAAGCGMVCCVLGVVFCVYSVIASLILLLTGFKLVDVALSAAGVVVVTLYLVFDTHAMMNDQFRKLSPHEFVRGNIYLYVDVVLLIIKLFRRCLKTLTNKIKPDIK